MNERGQERIGCFHSCLITIERKDKNKLTLQKSIVVTSLFICSS